jgi:hypothetical protein
MVLSKREINVLRVVFHSKLQWSKFIVKANKALSFECHQNIKEMFQFKITTTAFNQILLLSPALQFRNMVHTVITVPCQEKTSNRIISCDKSSTS